MKVNLYRVKKSYVTELTKRCSYGTKCILN